MWFYEFVMACVFGTIGTIVGTVTILAFIMPNSIFAHWYGANAKNKTVVKEREL